MTVKKILVGTLMLLMAASLYAQTPAPQEEKPKVEARSPYRVVVFDVRHRNPDAIARALVGSGAQGTQIIPNRELKTITVRDYPENIAVIGEAIKRFDVPTPDVSTVPESLELQLHLIAASQTPSERGSIPVGLEKAVQQMKATLKYADYRFLTTLASRVSDGGSVNSNGYINPPFSTSSNAKSAYTYQLQRVNIITDGAGREAYQIRQFHFSIGVPIVSGTAGATATPFQNVGFQTELTLREGETAVVGTANVGGSDEAIIVIVTAKKVK